MGTSNTKCSDLDGEFYTQIEIDNYQKKRKNLFMGTILICGIYAVISLILILLGTFTDIGKELLFYSYLPFTIIFIIGSIIIILYFSNKIYKFKPYKLDNTFRYDDNSCPDYWNIAKLTDKTDLTNATPSGKNSGLFKYVCKADSNIYNKKYMLQSLNNDSNYNTVVGSTAKTYSITGTDGTAYFDAAITSATPMAYNYDIIDKANDSNHIFANLNIVNSSKIIDDNIAPNFKKNALYMAGYNVQEISGTNYGVRIDSNNNNVKVSGDADYSSGTTVDISKVPKIGGSGNIQAVPLLCDKVYPNFLASQDNEYNKKNPLKSPNPYRCSYSRVCGVSWSDLDCEYETKIN